MAKVYDLEGKEFDKEEVDVRECVEVLGWSRVKPEEAKEEAKPEVKGKKQSAE